MYVSTHTPGYLTQTLESKHYLRFVCLYTCSWITWTAERYSVYKTSSQLFVRVLFVACWRTITKSTCSYYHKRTSQTQKLPSDTYVYMYMYVSCMHTCTRNCMYFHYYLLFWGFPAWYPKRISNHASQVPIATCIYFFFLLVFFWGNSDSSGVPLGPHILLCTSQSQHLLPRNFTLLITSCVAMVIPCLESEVWKTYNLLCQSIVLKFLENTHYILKRHCIRNH